MTMLVLPHATLSRIAAAFHRAERRQPSGTRARAKLIEQAVRDEWAPTPAQPTSRRELCEVAAIMGKKS